MELNLVIQDSMHRISQGILYPVIAILIILILISIVIAAMTIVEYFTERRHHKVNAAAVVNAVEEAPYEDVPGIVEQAEVLRTQKAALLTVARNMGLGEEKLFSLAQVQMAEVESRYKGRLAVGDVISKLGPMLGLMGTLIPLGPGIVALGLGDTVTLSNSLLIAFDTTVCGMLAACVAIVVNKVRSRWYERYLSTLDALTTAVLEKADEARQAGVQLPCGYVTDPLAELAEAERELKAQQKAEKKSEAEAAKADGPEADAVAEVAEAAEAADADAAADAVEAAEDEGASR